MVNLNANINSVLPKTNPDAVGITNAKTTSPKSGFADTVKAVEKHLSKVDDLQQSSDISIKDLLSGKNEDITSVVSAVAKADMSFKLLVGVRNKLIEAYKQTMNMPL